MLHGGAEKVYYAMWHRQEELWRDCSLILHHDNNPAHSLLQMSQFLEGKDISMDDLLYSPAPADFWLFVKHEYAERKEFLGH
jgi:hypothetical protein